MVQLDFPRQPQELQGVVVRGGVGHNRTWEGCLSSEADELDAADFE
jgi:hypothetical protein